MWKKGDYRYLGNEEFFDMYSKRGIKFALKEFDYPIDTRKRKIEIDYKTYKAILGKYFKIYFTELYYQPKPKYFFLSGMMEKIKLKRNLFYPNASDMPVGFVWYKRPQISYLANVYMVKLNKCNFMLRKIELEWRKSCNYDAIKDGVEFLRYIRENGLKHNEKIET